MSAGQLSEIGLVICLSLMAIQNSQSVGLYQYAPLFDAKLV